MPVTLTVVLAIGLLAAPLAAPAQAVGKVYRIGLLDSGSLAGRALLWGAFRRGMRELGYVEGRSVIFEARGAEGKSERLPGLAAELVRLEVDVIVTSGPATQAARQATATVPIVRASGNPLEYGDVASLARPGGNVTGLTTLSVELSAKRLELARDLVPGASRFVILWRDSGVRPALAQPFIRETRAAAQTLGVRLDDVGIRDSADLDKALSTIAQHQRSVLLVVPGPTLFGERRQLADLAVKHRLPTVHGQREYVEAGGLSAYGVKLTELFRRAAVYVDKILKGARPADLPVEQPTKFELVVNLKTARALGLTIPQAVLARADEVIE